MALCGANILKGEPWNQDWLKSSARGPRTWSAGAYIVRREDYDYLNEMLNKCQCEGFADERGRTDFPLRSGGTGEHGWCNRHLQKESEPDKPALFFE